MSANPGWPVERAHSTLIHTKTDAPNGSAVRRAVVSGWPKRARAGKWRLPLRTDVGDGRGAGTTYLPSGGGKTAGGGAASQMLREQAHPGLGTQAEV